MTHIESSILKRDLYEFNVHNTCTRPECLGRVTLSSVISLLWDVTMRQVIGTFEGQRCVAFKDKENVFRLRRYNV